MLESGNTIERSFLRNIRRKTKGQMLFEQIYIKTIYCCTQLVPTSGFASSPAHSPAAFEFYKTSCYTNCCHCCWGCCHTLAMRYYLNSVRCCCWMNPVYFLQIKTNFIVNMKVSVLRDCATCHYFVVVAYTAVEFVENCSNSFASFHFPCQLGRQHRRTKASHWSCHHQNCEKRCG